MEQIENPSSASNNESTHAVKRLGKTTSNGSSRRSSNRLNIGWDVAATTSTNEHSLQRLVRTIHLYRNSFALIIVHCNYARLRQQILSSISDRTKLSYREVWCRESQDTLYHKLHNLLKEESLADVSALMCLGLEHSINEVGAESSDAFSEVNLYRDYLKRRCNFPIVLWLNEHTLKQLWAKAPEFAQLAAPPIKFELSVTELIDALQQQVTQFFDVLQNAAIPAFAQDSQIDRDRQFLNFTEIEMARKELRIEFMRQQQLGTTPLELENAGFEDINSILNHKYQTTCAELQAKLDFLMGWQLWRSPNQQTQSLNDIYEESRGEIHSISEVYYQCSLIYWQQNHRLLERGIVLFYLGNLWWRNSIELRKQPQHSAAKANQLFQEATTYLEQAGRQDLVAKYGSVYSATQVQLQHWKTLKPWLEKLMLLHQQQPLELAQDYGYLAQMAIANHSWQEAINYGQQSLKLLETIPASLHADQDPQDSQNPQDSIYRRNWLRLHNIQSAQARLFVAQGYLHLQNLNHATSVIEKAIASFDLSHAPTLYIQILETFHQVAFAQGRYLDAFQTRKKQRSLEQQYGLRAFVGAESLQPQRNPPHSSNIDTIPATERQRDINFHSFIQQTSEISASGRNHDVEYLVEKILSSEQCLTVIHGESGVGKSSLVNAGLIPALCQRSLIGQEIRPIKISVYTNWRQVLSSAIGMEPTNNTDFILYRLQQIASHGTQIILVFDQFEEFFFTNTLNDAQQVFIKFWQNCIKSAFLKLVISIREDYLHLLLGLDSDNGDIDILSRNFRYALGNLSLHDAKILINNVTTQANFILEPALVEALVQDLGGDRGTVRPIELQLVGSQLQDRNITTLAEYQQAGGKQKLVEQSVQEVIKACGHADFIAQQVLVLLTDEYGKRPLKTYSELRTELLAHIPDPQQLEPKLDLVLEILVGSGLVFQLPEVPHNRYQLVHDYLASFIRSNQESELLGELQKVRSSEERSRANLNRLTKIALLGTALGLIMMAGLAFQANRQRQIAQLGEINALVSSANSSFLLNQQLKALETILTSAKKLEALNVDLNIDSDRANSLDRNQIVQRTYESLQLIIYNIRERYQFTNAKADSPFYVAKFSPDGKMIALAGFDGSVYLFQSNGKPIAQMTGFKAREIRGLSFSNDGKKIASSGSGKIVRIWDVQTGKLLQEFSAHQDDVLRVDFHPDGKRLLTASKDGWVKVWDSEQAVELLSIRPEGATPTTDSNSTDSSFIAKQNEVVQDASFSPDGSMIVTGKYHKIALWDLQGNQLAQINAHDAMIYTVRFNHQGNQLASSGRDKSVKLWQIAPEVIAQAKLAAPPNTPSPPSITPKLKLVQLFEGNASDIISLSFSNDDSRLAFGFQNNSVVIFNLDGSLDSVIGEHSDGVFDVVFSPNDRYLLSASKDRSARLWYVQTSLLKTLYGHKNTIWSVSYSPNNQFFASGSVDKTVRIWNADGSLHKELIGHQDTVYGVSFSHDSKMLVSASEDGSARIWDSLTGKLLHVLNMHGASLIYATFSPDQKILATLGSDKKIKLWQWNQTNQPPLWRELVGHTQDVWAISFSPDSKFIASTGNDATIRIWEVQTGKSLVINDVHTNGGLAIAYSPDGKLIASVGKDGKLKLWEPQTGKLIKEIVMDRANTWSYGLAFHPNGQVIAVGNADKSIKIFDTKSGNLLKTLSAHTAEVNAIAFSPDGQKVVSASRDSTLRLWNAETLDFRGLVDRGCQLLQDYLENSTNSERSNICQSPRSGNY
ncbi:MAG: hypothetical protein NW214_09940 [Pseudanabaenaceae cyanobacterium bins.39]|nr:hypothetical protein [Pseudanabaenaceae cyanobacterium bins.39]